MAILLKRFTGAQIKPYIEDLARLRIRVFRDFPYLYDGDMSYEYNYIETYARSKRSLFVLACDGDRVIGAATGVPMEDETNEFKQPFEQHGYDPSAIFYFGESVLLPEYRGQGVGVAFFEQRERYARELAGITRCCFCAVERPDDHPMKPANYQPLDAFWGNRGYTKEPALTTEFSWKDVGEEAESAKRMTFWIKKFD